MNGMITTDPDFKLEEVIPRLHAYTTGKVVEKVTCEEKSVLKGKGPKVALMDFGAKENIAESLNKRGCQVTIYPAFTKAEELPAPSVGPSSIRHLQQRAVDLNSSPSLAPPSSYWILLKLHLLDPRALLYSIYFPHDNANCLNQFTFQHSG